MSAAAATKPPLHTTAVDQKKPPPIIIPIKNPLHLRVDPSRSVKRLYMVAYGYATDHPFDTNREWVLTECCKDTSTTEKRNAAIRIAAQRIWAGTYDTKKYDGLHIHFDGSGVTDELMTQLTADVRNWAAVDKIPLDVFRTTSVRIH